MELDDGTGQIITNLVYRGENNYVKVVASGVRPDVYKYKFLLYPR